MIFNLIYHYPIYDKEHQTFPIKNDPHINVFVYDSRNFPRYFTTSIDQTKNYIETYRKLEANTYKCAPKQTRTGPSLTCPHVYARTNVPQNEAESNLSPWAKKPNFKMQKKRRLQAGAATEHNKPSSCHQAN